MDTKEIGKFCSNEFLAEADKSIVLNSNDITSQSSFWGSSRFYAHDNLKDSIKGQHSCGHAAIATILDYYNRSPWNIPRNAKGIGLADDGKMHFSDQLVENVYQQYPPSDFLGIKFTVKESIIKALETANIHTEEAYAGAFEGGETYAEHLKNWISKYKLPVITLLDCHTLQEHTNIWYNQNIPWYTLHWGIVFGFDNQNVFMASWKQVYHIPWDAFMESWHCKGLSWPNNYYAIYNFAK